MILKLFLSQFYFNRFFISNSKSISVSTMILTSLTFFIISIVSFSINHYKDTLSQSFGAKQPHILIKALDEEKILDEKQRAKFIHEIFTIIDKNELKSVSSYIEEKLNLSLSINAMIGTPKVEGEFTVIGQYKTYPLTFDFIDIKYFDTDYGGITYKEFLHSFDKWDNMIVVNNVTNDGFTPQLGSKQTTGTITVFDRLNNIEKHEFIIGGSKRDYKKESILYTNASFVNKLASNTPNSITGFAINLQNTDIQYLNQIVKKLQMNFSDEFEVVSWLKANQEQLELLNLYEILSDVIQGLVLVTTSSAILLLIFRTLLSIQPQIRSLYLMGENLGKSTIIYGSIYLIIFSSVGVAIALILLGFYYDFNFNFLVYSGFVERLFFMEVLFLFLFIVGLTLIFQIKKIEIS